MHRNKVNERAFIWCFYSFFFLRQHLWSVLLSTLTFKYFYNGIQSVCYVNDRRFSIRIRFLSICRAQQGSDFGALTIWTHSWLPTQFCNQCSSFMRHYFIPVHNCNWNDNWFDYLHNFPFENSSKIVTYRRCKCNKQAQE